MHGDFSCLICDNVTFPNKIELTRHMKSHRYTCDFCLRSFQHKTALRYHIKQHLKDLHGDDFKQKSQASHASPRVPSQVSPANLVQGETSALNRRFVRTRFDDAGTSDPPSFFEKKKNDVKEVLENNLNDGVKWFMAMQVLFKRETDNGEQWTDPVFRAGTLTLLGMHDFESQFEDSRDVILERISNFQREGSGWVFDRIVYLDINCARYDPLSGNAHMVLPEFIRNKRAVLNIQNEDQKCFLWCVLAAQHIPDLIEQGVTRNLERVNHYRPYEKELNMDGISLPVQVREISRFERQNPSYSVNVLSFQENKKTGICTFFPLYLSNQPDAETEVDLLLDSRETGSHYSLIRSMSRLLSHTTRHNGAVKYLQHFISEETWKTHKRLCEQHVPQAVKMPEEGKNFLQFDEYQKTYPVPFVIYADFETFISPVENPSENSNANTQILSEHIPCGFCYVVIGKNGLPVKEPVTYRGENVVEQFLACLLAEEDELKKLLARKLPLKMTEKEKLEFWQARECGICKKPFLRGQKKVRDHDHETGKFRQAAHNHCNLKFQKPMHIPVIFHNLRGYDSHLIFQKLGVIKEKKISCIANNMEKYISFTVGSLRFLDSLQFLNASLATLVANLAKEGAEKFKITRTSFPNPDELKLLLRKGVYPYEYVTDAAKFEEQQLPSKEKFYSSLTGEHISQEDYDHAKNVWSSFKIKTLGEYHDLYLKSDVLLLSDIFQSFRQLCREFYGLDPCHFYTSPGLSFQACLKMTGVRLELFTDIDTHLFIEAGIRGGVSVISHRLSVANNKYMGEKYRPEKPSKYIMYWDANNLYGKSMSMYLPEGGFRFLSQAEIDSFDLESKDLEGPLGWILEVDLEYPKNLHDLHNDYPLAPEKIQITSDMLSPYSTELLQTLNCGMGKVPKLVPNLMGKSNYVVHFCNLRYYLELGMKLNRIHRILEFRQSPWLKKYIDFNSQKRK